MTRAVTKRLVALAVLSMLSTACSTSAPSGSDCSSATIKNRLSRGFTDAGLADEAGRWVESGTGPYADRLSRLGKAPDSIAADIGKRLDLPCVGALTFVSVSNESRLFFGGWDATKTVGVAQTTDLPTEQATAGQTLSIPPFGTLTGDERRPGLFVGVGSGDELVMLLYEGSTLEDLVTALAGR